MLQTQNNIIAKFIVEQINSFRYSLLTFAKWMDHFSERHHVAYTWKWLVHKIFMHDFISSECQKYFFEACFVLHFLLYTSRMLALVIPPIPKT